MRSSDWSSDVCSSDLHRTQRRLRQLARCLTEVLHPNDRLLRIDDAEVDYGIDLDRDVVARDDVLGRHVLHDGAQIDSHHLLDDRNEDDEAGPLHAGEAAEGEYDATLVLAKDLDHLRRSDEHTSELQSLM